MKLDYENKIEELNNIQNELEDFINSDKSDSDTEEEIKPIKKTKKKDINKK